MYIIYIHSHVHVYVYICIYRCVYTRVCLCILVEIYIYWWKQLKNFSLTGVCNRVGISTSGTKTYSSPRRESRAWSLQTGALSSHYSSMLKRELRDSGLQVASQDWSKREAKDAVPSRASQRGSLCLSPRGVVTHSHSFPTPAGRRMGFLPAGDGEARE